MCVYVYMSWECAYMSAGASIVQKRASDPTELKSSARTVYTLNL